MRNSAVQQHLRFKISPVLCILHRRKQLLVKRRLQGWMHLLQYFPQLFQAGTTRRKLQIGFSQTDNFIQRKMQCVQLIWTVHTVVRLNSTSFSFPTSRLPRKSTAVCRSSLPSHRPTDLPDCNLARFLAAIDLYRRAAGGPSLTA